MDSPSPRNGAPLLSSPFARSRVARTPCPTLSLQAAVLPWPLPLVSCTAVDAALDSLSTVGLAPSVLRHLSVISGSAVRLRLRDPVSGSWRERIVQAVLMDAPTVESAQRCAHLARHGERSVVSSLNGCKLADSGRSTRTRRRSKSPDAHDSNVVWVPPSLLFNLGVQPHFVSLRSKGRDTSSKSTYVSVAGARQWIVNVEVSPAGWRRHDANTNEDAGGSGSDSNSANDASSSADEGNGSEPSSRGSISGISGGGGGGSRRALVACPPELRRAGVETARLAVVARVRAPGPSSSGHANYAAALGSFFDTPRLLALGDVFPVPVSRRHHHHHCSNHSARHDASAAAAPSVVYFTVVALESSNTSAHRSTQGMNSSSNNGTTPALWLSKEHTMLMQEGACNCAVPDPRLLVPFLVPLGTVSAADGDSTALERARQAVLESTCAAICPQPVDELRLAALVALLRPLAPSPASQPTSAVGFGAPSRDLVAKNKTLIKAANAHNLATTRAAGAAQAAAQEHASSRCAVLLHGRSGSGKAQLAVRAAVQLGFKVVRLRLNLAAGGYGPATPSSYNENEDDDEESYEDGGDLDDFEEYERSGGDNGDSSNAVGGEGSPRSYNSTHYIRTAVASSAAGRDAIVVSAIEAAFAEATACAPCVLLLQGLEALGAANHASGTGGGGIGGSGGGGSGGGNSGGPLPASHPAATVARCLDAHAAANAAAAHWAFQSSSPSSGPLGANAMEQPEVMGALQYTILLLQARQ